LFLGLINGSGAGLGTGTYSAITTLNDSLKELDATYVDIRNCLINQALDRERLIPTPQDLSDIENDLVPSQLRSDGIHLNAFGYHAVAICVRDAIKASS
jgi:lysophospholipase L1-like esterase